MNAKDLLTTRLTQLGYDGHLASADDCRTAIISLLCAEAVCDKFETAKGVKLLKFAAAFELVFGQALETRERKERVKRKGVA